MNNSAAARGITMNTYRIEAVTNLEEFIVVCVRGNNPVEARSNARCQFGIVEFITTERI